MGGAKIPLPLLPLVNVIVSNPHSTKNANAFQKNLMELIFLLDIVLQKILQMTSFIAMSIMLTVVEIPNNLNVSTICITHTKPAGINGQRDMQLQIVIVKNQMLNVNLPVLLIFVVIIHIVGRKF